MTLADASLADIAIELKRRKTACPTCGGVGIVNRGRSMTSVSESEHVCGTCYGCGLVENARLVAIARELEAM